jgi:hypothetical protein
MRILATSVTRVLGTVVLLVGRATAEAAAVAAVLFGRALGNGAHFQVAGGSDLESGAWDADRSRAPAGRGRRA